MEILGVLGWSPHLILYCIFGPYSISQGEYTDLGAEKTTKDHGISLFE